MSSKPNSQLLGLRPGEAVHPVNAPDDYRGLLGTLPAASRVSTRLEGADVVQAFARDASEVTSALTTFESDECAAAALWVTYLKGDLKRQDVHDAMRKHGFKPVSQFAFTDDWSAIRCRRD